MSMFGLGAAAAGASGAATTIGAIAAAGAAGAAAAAVIAVGGTQVAANVTQPDATTANTASHVSQPNYAD